MAKKPESLKPISWNVPPASHEADGAITRRRMDGKRRSRTHAGLIYRWVKDAGHLEITGGVGQSDSLESSRRSDVPAGALRAATGAMDLSENSGSA